MREVDGRKGVAADSKGSRFLNPCHYDISILPIRSTFLNRFISLTGAIEIPFWGTCLCQFQSSSLLKTTAYPPVSPQKIVTKLVCWEGR